MPVPILMPALSPTMTEGTLVKWLKKEGEMVSAGDVLAEIETDKATMEIEAVDEGMLGRILVAGGTQGVAVNAPIAWLLEEGEDISALENAQIPAAAPSTSPIAAPQPAPQAAPQPAPQAAAPQAAPQPAPQAAPQPAPQPVPQPAPQPAPQAAPISQTQRVIASPLAKRLARAAGLDLHAVTGSGPHGRIIKADVEAALASGLAHTTASSIAGGGAASVGAISGASVPALISADGLPPYEEIPHSAMRRTIAERLSTSKREAPHFYLTIDCVIDELLSARKRLNEGAGEGKPKISVNDFVLRAVALALEKKPDANVSWSENFLRRFSRADIAVAVAVPGGLVTPVVRDCGNKGLAAIAAEVSALAVRAREGSLSPAEYEGGTFTVTNLGMFGIRQFDAVINPPQACILAIGAGDLRPVVNKEGEIVAAHVMTCTLSVDHRAVDGVTGAKFLAAFKRYVEDPLTMLL